MGVGQTGHILIFPGKPRQVGDDVYKLFPHQLEPFPHQDDVGVVPDKAAGGPQVDDALGPGTLEAVGVNVAHHVVAAFLFPGGGILVVDVLPVGLQLLNLLLGDGKALLLFRLGQGDPQLAPGAELVVFRKDKLHLPAGVPGGKGAEVTVVLVHNFLLCFCIETAFGRPCGTVGVQIYGL